MSCSIECASPSLPNCLQKSRHSARLHHSILTARPPSTPLPRPHVYFGKGGAEVEEKFKWKIII